jgi:hypothetical protein
MSEKQKVVLALAALTMAGAFLLGRAEATPPCVPERSVVLTGELQSVTKDGVSIETDSVVSRLPRLLCLQPQGSGWVRLTLCRDDTLYANAHSEQ